MSAAGAEPFVPRLLVDPERRAAVIRRALEYRDLLVPEVRGEFDTMLHNALELPAFLKAGEVPLHILVPVVTDLAGRDLGFLETLLGLWRRGEAELLQDLRSFLWAESAAGRHYESRLTGFPGSWRRDEMEGLTSAFASRSPETDPDDVALMFCLMTRADYEERPVSDGVPAAYAADAVEPLSEDDAQPEAVAADGDGTDAVPSEDESAQGEMTDGAVDAVTFEVEPQTALPEAEDETDAPGPVDEPGGEETIEAPADEALEEPAALADDTPGSDEAPLYQEEGNAVGEPVAVAEVDESARRDDVAGEDAAAAVGSADEPGEPEIVPSPEVEPEMTLLPETRSFLQDEERPDRVVESFGRDWSDWLAPWRSLEEFASEWDRLDSFAAALRAMAEGKRVERMAGREALRAVIDSLASAYAEPLAFFGIAAESWSAERAPLREASDYAAEVEALRSEIDAYRNLELQPVSTMEQRRRLRERMAVAEDAILQRGQRLNALLLSDASVDEELPRGDAGTLSPSAEPASASSTPAPLLDRAPARQEAEEIEAEEPAPVPTEQEPTVDTPVAEPETAGEPAAEAETLAPPLELEAPIVVDELEIAPVTYETPTLLPETPEPLEMEAPVVSAEVESVPTAPEIQPEAAPVPEIAPETPAVPEVQPEAPVAPEVEPEAPAAPEVEPAAEPTAEAVPAEPEAVIAEPDLIAPEPVEQPEATAETSAPAVETVPATETIETVEPEPAEPVIEPEAIEPAEGIVEPEPVTPATEDAAAAASEVSAVPEAETPVVEAEPVAEAPTVEEPEPVVVPEPPEIEEPPVAADEAPVVEDLAPAAEGERSSLPPSAIREYVPPVEPEAVPSAEPETAASVPETVEEVAAEAERADEPAPEINPLLKDKMAERPVTATAEKPTTAGTPTELVPDPSIVPVPPVTNGGTNGGYINGTLSRYEDLLSEEELHALHLDHPEEEHPTPDDAHADVALTPMDAPPEPEPLRELPAPRAETPPVRASNEAPSKPDVAEKPDEKTAEPPAEAEKPATPRSEPIGRIPVATRIEQRKPAEEPPAETPAPEVPASLFQRFVRRVTGWLMPWKQRERTGNIHFGEVAGASGGEDGASRSAEMIDDFLADPSGTQSGENPYGRLFIDNLDTAPQEIGPVSITREEGTRSVHRMLAIPGGGVSTSFQTTLIVSKTYSIHFTGLTPNNLRLTLRFRSPGDWVRINLPYTWRQVYVYRDQDVEAPLAAAASMRSFEASEGDRYYLADGTLHLKLMVREGKARGTATLEVCLHPKKK